ncbi:MAG: hypothetical protein ACLTKG_04295 [Collinsella intestinalis]
MVVKAEGSDVGIASLEDVKNIEGKVAIGDAVTVPAGKYANRPWHHRPVYRRRW